MKNRMSNLKIHTYNGTVETKYGSVGMEVLALSH